jgi:hypothetical protein
LSRIEMLLEHITEQPHSRVSVPSVTTFVERSAHW